MNLLKRLFLWFGLSRRLTSLKKRTDALLRQRTRRMRKLTERKNELQSLMAEVRGLLDTFEERVERDLEKARDTEQRLGVELQVALNEAEAVQRSMDVVMTQQRSLIDLYEAETAVYVRRRAGVPQGEQQ